MSGNGESPAPGQGIPERLGRATGGFTLFALLVLSTMGPELLDLDRLLLQNSPPPSSSSPDSLRSFAIPRDARPGPLPYVFRFAYPADWLTRNGESAPPLAVFIDGRRAVWLPEEPLFEQLGTERIYAYLREAKSQSFFVVCPQGVGCARVDIVRDDAGARLALAWIFRDVAAPVLARLALLLALLVFLTWLLLKRLSGWLLAGLIAVLVWMVFVRGTGRAGSPEMPILVAGAALLVTPLLAAVQRRVGDARRWIMGGQHGRVSITQVAVFLLISVVSAWPGLRTVPGWFPGDRDDTHVYVSAASRFLQTDDLTGSAFQAANWRYSAYPLLLAAFSKAVGLHPMDAFALVSALGAIALVAAAGALAWIATGRLTTALLATWISGTWGGLGAWVWAIETAPSLLAGDPIRFFVDDYHEPRFLGEFTGPYSELTTYMTAAPFYPREAGLIPFWLGLGLLYRRLQPELRPPPLLAIGGLFLISTAVYPPYGLAAPLALGVAAIAERSGDEALRRRRRRTISAAALVALVAGVIGDLAVRAYRGRSAWEWVSMFLASAPQAVAVANHMPSLDFLAGRMFGGEFFLALAFAGALGLGFRPRGSFSEPQRRAALVTLLLCVAHGIASQWNAFLQLVFFNFRWFVSWRALLTPITALVAALFIERMIAGAKSRHVALLAALAVIPAFSGFLWSYNVTDYLTREREGGGERQLMARLWSEYHVYGRSLLGHVVIPEPLAIEGAKLAERSAASAAFGIEVREAENLFNDDGVGLPAALGTPQSVNSVALRRGWPVSARLVASGCCTQIASYGGYDIYVRQGVPATSPPRSATPN